jgi:hypothetical protein
MVENILKIKIEMDIFLEIIFRVFLVLFLEINCM